MADRDRYERAKVEVLVGMAAIAPQLEALCAAAAGWRQLGEATDLAYFLSRPERVRIMPHLLLLIRPESQEILAAVLVFHYDGLLRPLGLYTSWDRRGRRTVFAPADDRPEVAALAARVLLRRGARFVNLDIEMSEPPEPEQDAPLWHRRRATVALRLRGISGEWALHNGRKRFDLELKSTYDATVAALGKRTRRNLRYYERLCVEELGCVFLPEVELDREAFLAMNRDGDYTVAHKLAVWRHDSLSRFPGTFAVGVQDGDGVLLSMLGGRRHEGEVEIDWQMNRRGLERYSLSTAMRSMLIDHEVERGSRSLYLEGGTVHSMASSLRMRSVYNLAVRRPSRWVDLQTAMLARFKPEGRPTLAMRKPWRRWNG